MSHEFRVTVGRNAGTIHTVSNGFFFFEVYGDKDEAQKVCDRLNELHEENTNLRKEKECDKQVFTKKRLHELLQQTQKENEQLKDALNQRTDQCDKYYKENEQLRHDATILIQSNQDYRRENEQLKHRLAISEKANLVTTLEKENEHIKTTIKTMMENERTELGRSVLRQLWENIGDDDG